MPKATKNRAPKTACTTSAQLEITGFESLFFPTPQSLLSLGQTIQASTPG